MRRGEGKGTVRNLGGLEDDDLVTPAEIAGLLRVDPKTVSRWAAKGQLGKVVKTPGGHRRIRWGAVMQLLQTEERATNENKRQA